MRSSATIVRSTVSDNYFGIVSGTGPIYVSGCVITGNITGLIDNNGPIYSGGDNVLVDNFTDGSFTGPIPLK